MIHSKGNINEVVKKVLKQLFGDELATNHLQVASLEPYTPPGNGESIFNNGSRAVLDFSTRINHPTLEAFLHSVLGGDDPDSVQVPFRLENPEFSEGSSAGYNQWTLTIARPPDDTRRGARYGSPEAARLAVLSLVEPDRRHPWPAIPNRPRSSALLLSLLLILAYVWFRFKEVTFGVASILALIHDVLITLVRLALSPWLAEQLGLSVLLIEPFKINLPIVAAFLTIIGYSLNDTIVIFDRVREIRGKSPNITRDLLNTAINQTLSRTILTSLTVFLVVSILYIAGGQGIHGFAFALVVGTVAGTYSTMFIACPALLAMVGTSPEPVKASDPKSNAA